MPVVTGGSLAAVAACTSRVKSAHLLQDSRLLKECKSETKKLGVQRRYSYFAAETEMQAEITTWRERPVLEGEPFIWSL